ncbi:hypothetical protein D9619_008210 [Psilocybe cf. subviscida]|uniref:Uncharacterized protein n=1 Tax=Psilocybe cf. subviscida TaxID=2480587 RepID=A0A8H5AUA9_9AGAR|nr:hypothetical protein D9619_008210 [Psilocybe cf. subviscida]
MHPIPAYKEFAPSAQDWLTPEGQTTDTIPPGYERLEISLASFRREMLRTTTARQTKDKGWALRLINSLTTGEQEINSARQALAAYWDSLDVTMLDTAINHFRQDRCESCGHRQEDLERTIRTGEDARNLWEDRTNNGVYGVILYNLASTHQHLYEQSIAMRGFGGSNLGAFELETKYFLQAMPVDDGDPKSSPGSSSGVLIMMRCMHEDTTSELQTCIYHWEWALKELNSSKPDTQINSKKKQSRIVSDKLIKEDRARQGANITYQPGFAYQLQYCEDHDSRLRNLNTTIDYLKKARLLFKETKNLSFSRSALARSLLLSWELTDKQSDMDRALELLKSAHTVENDDDQSKQKITTVLTAVQREVESH